MNTHSVEASPATKVDRMTREEIAVVLNADLFHNMGGEALERVFEGCDVIEVPAGHTLLRPNQQNDTVFLVLKGRMHVYLDHNDLPHYLTLRSGECVGEMSIIDGRGASALVVASTDARLMRMDGETLWSLVNNSHAAARNLLFILASRMRHSNDNLTSSLRNQREFERAASIDGLTGLYNRRWMNEAFPRQIERCARQGRPVSLLLADVDHFKTINDEHGHLVGDRALNHVASLLERHVRPGDMLARYGGEEFAVLLPEAGPEAASLAAERLRKAISEKPVPVTSTLTLPPLTLSLGVSVLMPNMSLDGLIAAADVALYRAKSEGRNCVRCAPCG